MTEPRRAHRTAFDELRHPRTPVIRDARHQISTNVPFRSLHASPFFERERPPLPGNVRTRDKQRKIRQMREPRASSGAR